MHRYFITGTDTDVGKTRVTAALALALRQANHKPTIVKPVQTGVANGEPGDAHHAAHLAGVPYEELRRFKKPADPYNAALAEDTEAPTAEALAKAIVAIPGALVVEGAGGVLTPLSAAEPLGLLARHAGLQAIVVTGLRLGCINHTLLTLAACADLQIPVAGGVLVERWGPAGDDYREDVRRALQGKLRVFGILPFAPNEAESVAAGAQLFQPLMSQI